MVPAHKIHETIGQAVMVTTRHCTIVSLQNKLHYGSGCLIVHISLLRLKTKHIIKCELLLSITTSLRIGPLLLKVQMTVRTWTAEHLLAHTFTVTSPLSWSTITITPRPAFTSLGTSGRHRTATRTLSESPSPSF